MVADWPLQLRLLLPAERINLVIEEPQQVVRCRMIGTGLRAIGSIEEFCY